MKLLNRSLIIIIASLAAACSPKNGSYQTDTATIAIAAGSPSTIFVNPQVLTVNPGATFIFQTDGGVPPYKYKIMSGQATVTFLTGYFAAGESNSTVTVSISDASGLATTATITVGTGSGGGSGGGTNPVLTQTNCASMLSDSGDWALEDTTVSGLGDVMSAENVGDPSSCASWCGSIGAAYCEWALGSATAVCVAWAPGTPMAAPYQSSATVYAGQCN